MPPVLIYTANTVGNQLVRGELYTEENVGAHTQKLSKGTDRVVPKGVVMPTVANLPGADVVVIFPSGEAKTVFMPRLLVQAQNAEFKAAHGMFLPNVGKLRPTLKKLREEYEIPVEAARTWEQMAVVLRGFYMDLARQIKEAQ